MGVWRNWHTRKIQNFVGVKSRVGSSPTTPTMTIKGKKVLEAIETQICIDQLQELLDYYNTTQEIKVESNEQRESPKLIKIKPETEAERELIL